jgi:hypothetical protein
MRKLYLPLCQIRPFAFYQGISTEPRVSRAPYHFLGDCIFLPSASISHSLPPSSFLPPPLSYSVLSAHGEKKPGPPCGRVDPFLGNREEAGRAGARRSLVTEDEPRPVKAQVWFW